MKNMLKGEVGDRRARRSRYQPRDTGPILMGMRSKTKELQKLLR